MGCMCILLVCNNSEIERLRYRSTTVTPTELLMTSYRSFSGETCRFISSSKNKTGNIQNNKFDAVKQNNHKTNLMELKLELKASIKSEF